MTRQNRVWPTGEIVADPARGMFMGNRGCLHDAAGRLGTARWQHRNWITCALSFKGRQRVLMSPGHYTELFFMDEAVACATGHRPCAACRRPAWRAFQSVWGAVHGSFRAAEIDCVLHAARTEGRAQRRHEAMPETLPDGAMVLINARPYLLISGQAIPWQAGGYGTGQPLPRGSVIVLTPAPLVAVMRAGWLPEMHATVLAQVGG